MNEPSSAPSGAGTTHPAIDTHLEILLRLVEAQPGSSMAICLTTPGGVIAGHLGSADSWADRWRDVVSAATGAEDRSDHMAQLAHAVQASTERTEKVATGGLHAFIHLLDVTFLSVPGDVTARLWRGRVSDVSGWSLGTPPPAASTVDPADH
ncbi:hypothetical protein ABT034_28655 [Streptomyces sp. NPDC002773]|uniref:hypothetical protein n=1 Tax=Streptomyces sp. NPDC002773 TaxID=3154430 RepID=UPI003330141C